MSEFAFEPNEMLRPLGEVYDDLRQHAGEMLGRISTRMGFGEAAIAYSESDESGDDEATAKMAEEKKEPEVIVTDEQKTKPDGTSVTVHTESLKPGSAGPGTGEGQPVQE